MKKRPTEEELDLEQDRLEELEEAEEEEEEEGEEEVEEESSLRDDLEAAIEEHENEEEEDDGSGTEGGSSDALGTEPDGEAPEPGTIGGAEGDPVPAGINAPIGYSAEEREAWKDVPLLVQQRITEREKEIADTVANTGEYRRTHTAMTNLAQSYAPILAAEGAETPMAAVEGLFRTVAELRMGNPQQTAQKMAQLISHYNIDISMLDHALSGAPMPNPEQTAMQKMIDERMAPVQQFLNMQKGQAQQQKQASQQAVNTELQTFAAKPEAEFLSDVRMDMADLIDLASKRGVQMSFEDAYAKACSINPSITKVLADRALIAGGKKADSKANASSSLRSVPGVAGQSSSDGSLRGDILAAMDSME